MSASREAYLRIQKNGGAVDLSSRVKLRVTGADRVRYLNGQLTADIRQLASGHAAPACVLTAKGKLCADVFITAFPDALIVDAEAALAETLLPRLQRYIIADDVEIEDVSEPQALIHFTPPLGAAGQRFSPDDMRAKGAIVVHRLGRIGFDFHHPLGVTLALLPPADHPPEPIDAALFELLRIEAGVPRWGYELNADTLPPEARLDRTHVDYHKGCYIGQEVVSRLKSVGHVNRQLAGFVSTDGAPLPVGAGLFAPGDEARAIGLLTSSVWSFALERPIALGYLRRGSPAGELRARSAEAGGLESIPVIVHELPFSS